MKQSQNGSLLRMRRVFARALNAVLFVLLLCSSASAQYTIGWQKKPSAGPIARIEDTMVYDSAHARMIMLGGYDLNFNRMNDLWESDPAAQAWTNRTPSPLPAAWPSRRSGHTMAYDPANQRVVLFGGSSDDWEFLNGTHLNDTWEWNTITKTWTNVTPSGARAFARRGAKMVYDSARSRIVMFGGNDAITYFPNPSPFGTGLDAATWIWNTTARTWTAQATTSTSPTGRYFRGRTFHGMAYNSARNTIWIYGGVGIAAPLTSAVDLGDVWEFNAVSNAWTDITHGGFASGSKLCRRAVRPGVQSNDCPRGIPQRGGYRYGRHAAVRVQRRCGGRVDTTRPGARHADEHAPPERNVCAGQPGNGVRPGASDACRIWRVFRGRSGVQHQHEPLDSSHGHSHDVLATAAGRSFAGLRARSRLALPDGRGCLPELYEGKLATLAWTTNYVPLNAPVSPDDSRTGEGVVYDSQRQRIVLFGGRQRFQGAVTPATVFGDTYEWDVNAKTWTARATSGPSPRYDVGMAYDGAARPDDSLRRARRGRDAAGRDLALERKLVDEAVTFVESERAHASGTRCRMDPIRGVIVLFGGSNGTLLADTWEWNGTGWAPKSSVTAPQARAFAAMSPFVATAGVAVFGGATGPSTLANDMWIWTGVAWAPVTATGSRPTPRQGARAVFDTAAQRIVLYGGRDADGAEGDRWIGAITRRKTIGDFDGDGKSDVAITGQPPASGTSCSRA